MKIDPALEDGFLIRDRASAACAAVLPECAAQVYAADQAYDGRRLQAATSIDAMFNLTSVMTKQTIHLCGMMTEAIHTPFLGDRALVD